MDKKLPKNVMLVSLHEAAEILGIPESELLGFEKKGMIARYQTKEEQPEYTKDSVEQLLHMLFYLQQKEQRHTKEKPDAESHHFERMLQKEKAADDYVEQRVIGTVVEQDNHYLHKLRTVHKLLFLLVVCFATIATIMILVITMFFLIIPEESAHFFGYHGNQSFAKLSQANGKSQVLGAHIEIEPEAPFLGKLLKPFSKISLIIVKQIDEEKHNIIAPKRTIKDVNDVLTIDDEGNIVPRANIKFPDSSYLKTSDGELVDKIKAEILKIGLIQQNTQPPAVREESGANDLVSPLVITSLQILDGTISQSDLTTGAVTTGILADGSVTAAKLASGIGLLGDNAVTSAFIKDSEVKSDDILDGTVGSNDLADAAVTDSKLAQITSTNKVAGSAVQLATGGGLSNVSGLSLLQTCNDEEVLAWSVANSAWECSATAAGTGDITSVTAGTGLSGGGNTGAVTLNATLGIDITNAEIVADTIDFSAINDSLTLDAATSIVAGSALNFTMGNNVTLTTSGTGTIVANSLAAGTYGVSISGNAGTVTNGLYTNSSFGGDVSGTYGAIVIANDSHDHTTTSISGLDVSNDTNLSASDGITLTGDALTNSDKGSSQNIFKTIAVSGQSDVVTDSNTDTITLIAGSNVTLTTDATNDTVTIAASGGGGSYTAGDDLDLNGSEFDLETTLDFVDTINFAGTGTLNGLDAIDATTESTIEGAIDTLANLTSASSLVTVGTLTGGATGTGFTLDFTNSTLSGNITGSNIDESSLSGIADGSVNNDLTISGGTINNTVIGGSTPAAATFTTINANSNTVLGDGTGDDSITIRKNGSGNVTFTGYAGCTALETDGSGNLTCGTDDSGGGTATLDTAYENGATANLDAGDVQFNLADATNDYKFVLNNNTNGAIATGFAVTTSVASGTIGTAIDLADADIATAIALGSNDVTVGGATLSSSELALLDAKTTLVDIDDAVGTAITGTGTLNSGSTSAGFTLNLGASTLVGNVGGGNIDESSLAGLTASNFTSGAISQWSNDAGYLSTVDISANTNLSASNGVTLTGDALSLSSSSGGDGLTYTNGVLAVGGGTGITIAADGISATLGTSIDTAEVDADTLTLSDIANSLTLDNNLTFVSDNDTNDYKLVFDNSSGGDVATLLQITSTGVGATIGTAFDISDADITTALAIGSNDVTVGGSTLSSTELALLDSGIAHSELTDSGTLTAGTVDINGGAIDGVTIGGASAGAGTFTTLTANGNTVLGDGSGNDSITIRKNGVGTVTFTGFNTCTALETDGSGNLTCGADDSGGAASLDTAYNNGGSITVDASDIAFNLSDATNDYKFVIDNSTNGAIAAGMAFTTSVALGTFTTAIDLSDADIATALALGSNDVTVGGVTLAATELALLDSKTTLVDTDDAVGTAITGTGTLTSGATGTGFTLNFDDSTLSGDITGANISSLDISDDTNLSASNGVTLSGDALSLSSTAGGDGLTYTNGVLAVGGGTGITIAADGISATLGTSIANTELDNDTIDFDKMADTPTLDGHFTITSSNATNDYKLVLDNSSTGDIAELFEVTTTGSGATIGTALNLSDADIATALALGSNDVTVGGVTIDSGEFARLNGLNAAIVDTNDAVATAITGTGTLTAGATGTGFTLDFTNSTLSGDITGSNISGIDISGDTNLSASDGIDLTGDALTNTDKGSSQNIFKTIAVAGQNNVVTDQNGDTLTLAAGTNVTITTNDGTDTITINAADTNTTYTAGDDLDLNGTEFDLETTLDIVETINLAGTGTLNGLDAIDDTTETTIEGAIDSLANLSTLTIGGDTITEFVGTGLQLSGSTLTASLGTSIANSELDNDTVDFDKMADALTLDTGTTFVLGNNDLTLGTNAGNGTVRVSPNAGGQAALIVDKQGTNDILAASASGTTRFVVSNAGGLAIEGSLSDITDTTLNINDALSVSGALSISGELSDSGGNLVLNDTVDIGGSEGIRIDSTGTIIDINGGTVAINDDLSVSGGDITGANSESIDIGETADGQFTLVRNDAGTVSLTAADGDAVTALTVTSGTSGALTLDSGTTGNVNLGTSNNAKTIAIGTGTAGNVINIGTDNSTQDTISIGSALDNVAITGDQWSITDAGVLTVASCIGCGGGGATLQTAYDTGNTLTTDATGDITFTLAELVSPTTFEIFNNDTAGVSGIEFDNTIASGTLTNGLLIEQSAAGTMTNAIQIAETAGTITDGILITGTLGNILNSASIDITGAGAITGATGVSTTTVTASSAIAANGGITFDNASDTLGAFTMGGNVIGGSFIITDIGSTGTDFTTSGALALTLDATEAEGALSIDNGNNASSIFVAEDNGVDVFTIADGGAVTATQNINADGGFDVDNNFVIADGGTAITFASATTLDLANTQTSALNIESGLLNIDTSNRRIGVNTTTPQATLDVRGSLATSPAASVSSQSNSFAAMVLDNSGSGDILTASSSGLTRFTVGNNGDVKIGSNGVGGNLITSNTGIEFTESDTNPGCAAGEYKIYADTSETMLKKCVNGVVTDLQEQPDVVTDTNTNNATWVDNDTTDLWTTTNNLQITVPVGGEVLVMASFITTAVDPGAAQVQLGMRVNQSGATSACADGTGSTVGAPFVGGPNTDLAGGAAAMYQGSTTFVDTSTTAGGVFEYELCSDGGSTIIGGGTWVMDIASLTLMVVNDAGDLAEIYPTNDTTLEAGEVVSIDPAGTIGIQRSSKAYDKHALGVIATKPALVIGSRDGEGIDGKPVALSGRVPVKVKGNVKKGDMLTASSTPGVAMKATKAGPILGIAMTDFSPASTDQIGKVMLFVKTGYFNGSNLSELIQSPINNGNNVSTVEDYGKTVLNYLLQEKANTTAEPVEVSEIMTDRIAAGIEVITPRIYADEIFARSIKADRIEGLEIYTDKIARLEEAVLGMQSISSSSYSADASNSAASTTGTEADDSVSQSLQEDEVALESLFVDGVATISGQLTTDSVRVKESLLVETIANIADTLMTTRLIVNDLATFFGKVIFKDDVEFGGKISVGQDSAGIAVVKKGTDQVEVKFEEAYEEKPIVNVSLSFDEGQEALEEAFMQGEIVYHIAQRSTKGFTIRLNTPAAEDMQFSWTAVAIKQKNASLPDSSGSILPSPTVVLLPTQEENEL